jgi:hypothetical protein
MFGSQNLVPKVCKYFKSGHTFGRCAVIEEERGTGENNI